MKSIKRIISVITALAVFVMTFSFLGLMPITSAVTAPEGYEIDEQITIDFNTDSKGWSDNNGTLGTNLTQVTDSTDSTNKYMHLYTPDGKGYNMELASGSNSDEAYTLVGSTKYSVTLCFKPVDSDAGNLALFVGSKSGSGSGYSKYCLTSWKGTTYTSDEWHTVTYEFTTTETMTYDSYNGSGNTNVCDRLYLVARGSENTWAIDDVVITKYKVATPKNQITYINFNTDSMGWSDNNGTFGTNLTQVTDSTDSTNKYMHLYTPDGAGYNMELASGSNSDEAYTLEASTKYSVTFCFKPVDSDSGNIALFLGSRAAAGGGYSKYCLTSWKGTTYTSDEWHTVTYEFTTTETMTYDSYNGSGNTNVCDRLYLVARGSENTWAIDDVEIKKYVDGADGDVYVDGISPDSGSGDGGSTGDDNTDGEETTKEMYTIPDFTHEPYLTYAAPDTSSGIWYCSLRWSTATDNDNSCMRYKFAYDISENAPSSSGSRGSTAMGTNGSTPASMCLVPVATPDTPITVTQGKSYKITFKYKVIDVELNSFVAFNIMRGKYASSWTASYGIGSTTNKAADEYIMAIEYGATDEWIETSYTFTADYTTNTEFDKMQIGGTGYGEALIDDIVIEEIDASEVVPPTDDNSKYVYTQDGSNVTITSYKANATDLTITTLIARKNLVEIGEYAFLYNRYTKNIIIENGPTTIGDYAFEYAKVLETISIPASVTSIGKGAFYGIKTMKSFTVDEANESFAAVDGVLYTKDMKTLLYYPAAKDATAFTVPDTVTTIAEGAFLNATQLEAVVLPEGLITIERRAFMNCSALTEINIPSTVTTIGSSAFRGCSGLTASNVSLSDSVATGENCFADSSLYTIGNVADSDDSIDLLDSAKLDRHLAGWDGYELDHFTKLAADINADGAVDMLDAALLDRHLAGWEGHKALPYTGLDDKTYEEYTSDSDTPELVVNLSEQNSRKVTSNRDIAYDSQKEDVIIILITGQSNSGTGGYTNEYQWKYTTNYNSTTHPDWEITAEPDRPDEGTVFFGATVTELTSDYDVYYKTDAATLSASTMGGYSPAMGKALHEATGAKIVFVQASKGAVGMHEWTPEPEKYECPCKENGGGVLYSQAIANFTKTYQALEENYNIIATAYVFNQGEHEEYSPYAVESSTVHDDATYYSALLEMHNGFLTECEIDCGGVFLPRSWWNRYGLSSSDDTEQNSRRPSIARAAQYAASQKVDKFFIFSNVAEQICKEGPLKPDPSNTIHYGQAAYNAIGAQNADSLAKYFGFVDASDFEGITVFNKIGVELCAFDTDGNLVSGSDVVEFSDDNSKLYIRINPTGTMYTLNYSVAGTTTDFVDDFGVITSVEGQTSFKIIINLPVR